MLDLIKLSRPKNAVPPLLWLLIGFAAGGGQNYNDAHLLICFLGVLMLNFFATLQNDLSDFAIDAGSGRSTALIAGKVSKNQAVIFTYSLLIAALALPIVFGYYQIAGFMAGYALLCVLYNLRPTQLSRRPVASLVVLGACFAALPFWFGFAISGHAINSTFWTLLAGSFLLRGSMSALKDYKDYVGDKKHSKITFLIRFGAKKLRSISFAAYVLGAALIISGVWFGTSHKPTAVAVLAVWAVYILSLRLKLSDNPQHFSSNNQLFHRLLDLCLIFEGLVLACFCIY